MAKRKYMSREEASALLVLCDEELEAASHDLRDAKELAERAGLWTEASILDPTFPDASKNLAVLRTTGGHSNTDHLVTLTGDARTDRIAELKRAMQRRARAMQPENKGEDRWDKPRAPGERRRRILREKDMPEAPPEPPPSGYVVFVGQMTTKIRHDRPDDHHNQVKGVFMARSVLHGTAFYSSFCFILNLVNVSFSSLSLSLPVVKEIGKVWRYGISEKEREYYNDFAREAREEYQEQYREYRATGRFTPSKTFKKLGPLWVRIKMHEKSALEREIDSYETVQFPPRPPEMDEAYRKREEESKQRRKEKLKAMREEQEALEVAEGEERPRLAQKHQAAKSGEGGKRKAGN